MKEKSIRCDSLASGNQVRVVRTISMAQLIIMQYQVTTAFQNGRACYYDHVPRNSKWPLGENQKESYTSVLQSIYLQPSPSGFQFYFISTWVIFSNILRNVLWGREKRPSLCVFCSLIFITYTDWELMNYYTITAHIMKSILAKLAGGGGIAP